MELSVLICPLKSDRNKSDRHFLGCLTYSMVNGCLTYSMSRGRKGRLTYSRVRILTYSVVLSDLLLSPQIFLKGIYIFCFLFFKDFQKLVKWHNSQLIFSAQFVYNQCTHLCIYYNQGFFGHFPGSSGKWNFLNLEFFGKLGLEFWEIR